jgi:hypothetical protein
MPGVRIEDTATGIEHGVGTLTASPANEQPDPVSIALVKIVGLAEK